MFYNFLFLTAILFGSLGFGSDQKELVQNHKNEREYYGKKQPSEPFEQGMPLPCGKYPCAYNAPAAICLKNAWDFNIFGSFIYWYASQDDMDIAWSSVQVSLDPAASLGSRVAHQNFKYEPGFKVGFGFNTDYDNWVFRAEYTWLHESVSTGAIEDPTLPNGTPVNWETNHWFQLTDSSLTSIASTWKLKLDMLDAVMQRPFYQGTKLTVTPFGGLRALWLRQKFTLTGIDDIAPATRISTNRSNSWALGPVTGVGGHWLLGGGFRFEGNALASLLYTRYTKIWNSDEPLPNRIFKSSWKNVGAVRPAAQLNLGLGWGRYFHGCNRDCYLDISIDYEFLEFWSQNMMRNFVESLGGFSGDIGDLQIHGLTATARFDF